MSDNWDHIVENRSSEMPLDAAAEVSRLEHVLGHALSPDYREFLIATNGGVPTLYYFEFVVDGVQHEDYVTRFLLNDVQNNRPCGIIYTMKLRGIDKSSGVVPIANTMADEIYLIMQGPRQGQVWMRVRDLETVEAPGPVRVFVANSFKEFCSMLREDPYA
jgi:hypothetical protein